MSFTSILQSIGSKFKLGIHKAVAIETALMPAEKVIAADVAIFNPVIGTTLSEFLNVIGGVEQVATAVGASTGTGKQKLAAAIPGIEAAIFNDPLFAGKKPADLDKFNKTVSDLTGTLADLFNSFEAVAAVAVPTVVTSTLPPGAVPVAA